MLGNATTENRDAGTPAEVIINMEARKPEFDATLGISVDSEALLDGTPRNRLVTIGDSLTHGFQSGAIYNTRLSWPMMVAYELGCDNTFRFPRYDAFGGLPLNIEYLLRALEDKFGSGINLLEFPFAGFELRHLMSEIEDYWERGPGSIAPKSSAIMHNLAVYGWDIRDVLSRTPANLASSIKKPKDDIFSQIVENANERAALRTYAGLGPNDTVIDAARALGDEGTVKGGDANAHGIETLVVFLGANNVLGTVTSLQVKWSGAGYDKLGNKNAYNVWLPSHFTTELKQLVEEIKTIKARHVIFTTVPHVTIAPIARGMSSKVRQGSRYFPYYTRPWISETKFDPHEDPHITENQARAIDSAIDQYNDAITAEVRTARENGLDWLLMDLAGLLDRLASRRYLLDPQARPDWWTPYELPPELAALSPTPDSRFFGSDPDGRSQGGLFSLDGVHPTTIGYGIIAQEFIRIMKRANVKFYFGDGKTERPDTVRIDFKRLLRLDSLMSSPPKSLSSDMKIIGWLDEAADIFGRLNPFNRG